VPELPEVETVRRGLNRVTLMQPIEGGDVLLNRTIAHPVSIDAFLVGLQGCAIAQWHRRGKYLLAELVRWPIEPNLSAQQPLLSGGWLGVHLRMTGQLLWLNPIEPVQKHCRVRLLFGSPQEETQQQETQRELRFVDQRTFGQMWWISPDMQPEAVMGGYARLGPEPLSEDFSVECLRRSLKQRHRPIKNALLDQQIVAGLGNIYADESLFMSRVRPTKMCDRLTKNQFEALHHSIITVLQSSIGEGGTTFSSFRDVDGINGNYGKVAWVYGREGEPCRVCGQPIQRVKMAGRSTYFCGKCQG